MSGGRWFGLVMLNLLIGLCTISVNAQSPEQVEDAAKKIRERVSLRDIPEDWRDPWALTTALSDNVCVQAATFAIRSEGRQADDLTIRKVGFEAAANATWNSSIGGWIWPDRVPVEDGLRVELSWRNQRRTWTMHLKPSAATTEPQIFVWLVNTGCLPQAFVYCRASATLPQCR